MKKSLLATLILGLLLAAPLPSPAEVFVDVNISLPPRLHLSAPPELVVLPGTYVYVAPDIDEEIFFSGGWWWRPWQGQWYRSQNYRSGWARYHKVPSFYRTVPSGWRDGYRQHQWQGRQWDHRRIPYTDVHRNWKGWERNRHWEKQNNWRVERPQHQQPGRSSREMYTPGPQPQSQPREAQSDRSRQHGQPGDRNIDKREERNQERHERR